MGILEILIILLIFGWALGLFAFHAGSLVYALLVIALVIFIIRMLRGGRPTL